MSYDRIETRRDDEHGWDRPWVALLDGNFLRKTDGRLRTFATEAAARRAAERILR